MEQTNTNNHSKLFKTGFNRRDFLKTAGLAAGALAFSGLPFILGKGARQSGMGLSAPAGLDGSLKVGVLLPKSRRYPDLASNLLAGMRAAAQQSGLALDLRAETLGVGLAPAFRLAERLLEKERVDLVVGMLHSQVAAGLRELFDSYQKPLIVAQVGERVVEGRDYSRHIFYNSLEYWRAAYAMGAWAAAHIGERGFISSSWYDSGFDSLYAFRRGFENAGGVISNVFVTHKPGGDFLTDVVEAIRLAQPDFVYGAYSGEEALAFVRAYAQAGFSGEVPLLGSGFLVEDAILAQHQGLALGVRSCMPWTSALSSMANRAFMDAFAQATGRRADAFALLGYDSVAWLLAALASNGASKRDLPDAMRTAQFESPRGALKVDPQTNALLGPFYVRQARRALGSVAPVNTVLEQVSVQPQALATAPASGWLNTYLC